MPDISVTFMDSALDDHRRPDRAWVATDWSEARDSHMLMSAEHLAMAEPCDAHVASQQREVRA